MKKFLKYISLTTLGFFLFLLGFEWGSSKIAASRLQYRLDRDVTGIILGHSQPECAYNDTIIKDFQNVARSAESYFYTYYKVKVLIEQNPQIDTVLLEFTNNYLENETAAWTRRTDIISNYYPPLSNVITITDKLKLLIKSPSSFIMASSLASKERLVRILKGNLNYTGQWGGYNYLIRNKTDSLIAHFRKEKKPISLRLSDNLNLFYLRKTINYLKEKDIQLFLVRSPINEHYKNIKYEHQFQKLLKNEFNDVEFLDFSDFPISNDEFGDLKHLNYKGARKYSKWFQQLLNEKLLLRQDKQEFINKEISKAFKRAS